MAVRYFYGYQATFRERGRRAHFHIQRDLRGKHVRTLEADIRRMTAGIGQAKAVTFELDRPLSRRMSITLWDLCQRHELPATVSVPALAPSAQAVLHRRFMDTTGRFNYLQIRLREPKVA